MGCGNANVSNKLRDISAFGYDPSVGAFFVSNCIVSIYNSNRIGVVGWWGVVDAFLYLSFFYLLFMF